jgi:hypothetical protein
VLVSADSVYLDGMVANESDGSQFSVRINCFDMSKGADTTSVSIAELREEQRSLSPESDKSLCLIVDVSSECSGFDEEGVDGISTS